MAFSVPPPSPSIRPFANRSLRFLRPCAGLTDQALNDLFSKIMERDVPERYLLRLGEQPISSRKWQLTTTFAPD